MAKTKTVFVCQNCGVESAKWIGRCPSCKEWNTYHEELIAPSTGHTLSINSGREKRKPELLDSIKSDEKNRHKTGISELDRILGGGMVSGSLILLGGEPGVGKSTLALQLALVGRKIRLRRGRHQRHLTADEALGAWRPRGRRPRNGELLGGHRREVELVVRPPALEAVAVHPRLDLHVDQSVCLELRDGPLGGLLRHRRTGQPRRVHVGEPACEVHHLRALKALGLDLVDVDVIDGLVSGPQCRSGQDGSHCDGAEQAGDDTLTIWVSGGRLMVHSANEGVEMPSVALSNTRFACDVGLLEFQVATDDSVPAIKFGRVYTLLRE